MELSPDTNEYDVANEALTSMVVEDLNVLLSAIKGRTIVMMNSLTPENPLQGHFLEILNCLDQSTELADILSDFSKADTMFKKIK